jgi:hypothetical protein
MIRRLAQCPFCKNCKLALDDHPQLVFEPSGAPCPHVAWVDGRYSQWERTPHGTDRVIGSTEFRYALPAAGDYDRQQEHLPYLQELTQQGPAWPFAPRLSLTIQPLSAEEKATDTKGRSRTVWDVDGVAIFAEDAGAFWSAVPECRQRQLASMELGGG